MKGFISAVLLAPVVAAVPFGALRRDQNVETEVVWVTVVDKVVKTVDVTTTVYADSLPTASTLTTSVLSDSTPTYASSVVEAVTSQVSATSTPVVYTAVAAATTSSASTAASTSSSSSTSSECTESNPCDGDITYYTPGLGACGWTNTEDDLVVALPSDMMGSQSNGNPYCGKTITITNGDKSTTAKVVDKCPGCSGYHIDLSPAAFDNLADEAEGHVYGVYWYFN